MTTHINVKYLRSLANLKESKLDGSIWSVLKIMYLETKITNALPVRWFKARFLNCDASEDLDLPESSFVQDDGRKSDRECFNYAEEKAQKKMADLWVKLIGAAGTKLYLY